MYSVSPNTGLCSELAHELGRHARLLHLFKSRASNLVPSGLDGAAIGLLMTLVKCGPRRQGELAETAYLDPSTVSRYASQLVRAGLVDRRPDPGDGRAVQLLATERGQEICAEVATRRELFIGEMLIGWSTEDAETLVRLIRRLNDEMDARRETPEPARTNHLKALRPGHLPESSRPEHLPPPSGRPPGQEPMAMTGTH